MIQSSTHLPHASLAPFISKYWIAQNNGDTCIDVPLLPDGYIDIVYHDRQISLYTLMDTTQVKSIPAGGRFIGVKLRADVISCWIDAEICNEVVELHTLDFALAKMLDVAYHDKDIYKALDSVFREYFRDKVFIPKVVQALDIIKKTHGNIAIQKLCKKVDISQKHLHRLFLKNVGVAPKPYVDIVRFYNIHRLFMQEGREKMGQKVLECGYYDQAHFNRHFKKLTGVQPSSSLMSVFYKT